MTNDKLLERRESFFGFHKKCGTALATGNWLRKKSVHYCHTITEDIHKYTAQHGRRETAVLCCGLEKNGMGGAWHGNAMASVNQTRPHYVNQTGKTHSKPLAARHGHSMLCVNRPLEAHHGTKVVVWTVSDRHHHSSGCWHSISECHVNIPMVYMWISSWITAECTDR